jgi:hypothetical protein
MTVAEWLAIVTGLAGGAYVAYLIGNRVLPRLVERAPNPILLIKLSFGGTLITLVPALLLSIVVGGTLGSTWGMLGAAIGVAAVFAVVVLAGTFAGVLLARLLRRPGA